MKLELRGITKRFGSLVANDHIDLVVQPGEIHCLLGENGAGKSTLMNVLYGLYQADEGAILLDDQVQNFTGPGDAMHAGIGMVHQHFMLIPVFTVAENVMLGHESTKAGGFLDLAAAREKVREISARFGFDVDPDALVEDLPVGVQQRVEIIKALSRDARVLVSGGGRRNRALMDGLASRLAPREVLPIDSAGIDGTYKEAIAFAILAYESALGRSVALPGVTGARHPALLGKLAFPPPEPPR